MALLLFYESIIPNAPPEVKGFVRLLAYLVPARVPRAEVEFFSSSFSACEDARGYDPVTSQQLSRFRTRPRPAGESGIFSSSFSACEDARGYNPVTGQQLTRFRTRPRPAGESGIFSSSFSACEDARGYDPVTGQQLSRFRTRPRPAGVKHANRRRRQFNVPACARAPDIL